MKSELVLWETLFTVSILYNLPSNNRFRLSQLFSGRFLTYEVEQETGEGKKKAMSEITTVIGRRHLYYNYRIRYLGQGKVVSAGRLAFVSVMTCCHETLRGSWEFCNSDSTT